MKSHTLPRISAYLFKPFHDYFERCSEIANKNYFTNVYSYGRTLLAIGTLITLLFSNKYVLFPEHLYKSDELLYFFKDYNLFFIFGYDGIWIAKSISILILSLVILGVYPRITGLLHWYVSFCFLNSCSLVDGGDQITAVMTFLLIPVTLLDNRSNHWSKEIIKSKYKNFTAYCLFVVMELQMAVVYLQAGIEKPYKVAEWLDGTAFYYWLNNNVFGGNDVVLAIFNPILKIPFFVSLMTWGVILFELSLFGLFFMDREKRRRFLKYALLFHFFIILFHGLISFFFAMAGGLFLYLLPKDRNINFNFFTTKDK
jgi:antimicrobial peptide system SdpB family protein